MVLTVSSVPYSLGRDAGGEKEVFLSVILRPGVPPSALGPRRRPLLSELDTYPRPEGTI